VTGLCQPSCLGFLVYLRNYKFPGVGLPYPLLASKKRCGLAVAPLELKSYRPNLWSMLRTTREKSKKYGMKRSEKINIRSFRGDALHFFLVNPKL